MPIIINLDAPAQAINAAQNVGNFATAEAAQTMALRQQQADLAQQEAGLRNLQAQQSMALQARNQDLAERRLAEEMDLRRAQLDQTDAWRTATLNQRDTLQTQRLQAQKELQDLRDANAAGRLDTQGQQRLDQLDAQYGYRSTLQDNQQIFTGEQNDLNRQSRETMQNNQLNNQINLQQQRLESAGRLQQIRIENQKLMAAARASRNPQEYQAAASHAKDVVDFAYRHRQMIARQLEDAENALAMLPPSSRLQPQRDALSRQISEFRSDLANADQAYRDAITAADAVRQGAAARMAPPAARQPGAMAPDMNGAGGGVPITATGPNGEKIVWDDATQQWRALQ